MAEFALTEHLFRFRQADGPAGGVLVPTSPSAALAAVDGRLLGFPRPRPTSMRTCAGPEAKPPAFRRHRPGGRLLPGADGRGGRPAGRLPLRRAAGLGALAGRLALRRHRRPAVDGRVVGPQGRRLLGRVHRGARGAGRLRGLRRPGPPRPDQGGRATCPTHPTSGGTAWPRRRPPRAWRRSSRRPVGASRWESSTRRPRCSNASPPAGCRSPPPRTPTATSRWPTGRPTCAPCWTPSASTTAGLPKPGPHRVTVAGPVHRGRRG